MKTRFAPSPTGELHLGNLFIASLNALCAYHHQGEFLLRIEDTDLIRSDKKFIASIEKNLEWCGLQWDTKQTIFQSQRKAIYEHYYQLLLQHGFAYPCFCSEARLVALRAQQRMNKKPPGYDKKCAHLSQETILENQRQKKPYHLRFRVPEGKSIVFEDCIKGEQIFRSEVFSDFVIRRSDGSPAFLYCNALDDALTQITHVIRGEDHLSNTARQLCLLNTLDLPVPHYGHVPLISMQGSNKPLSKRDSHFSMADLRQAGYLPLALLNYLARLTHNLDPKLLMPMDALINDFSLNHIRSSAPHFDIAQLNFWQKQAIRHQSFDEFWNSLETSVQILIPLEKKRAFIDIMQDMVTLPSEATQWAQIFFTEPLSYVSEMKKALQEIEPQFWSNIIELLETESIQGDLKVQRLKGYMNSLDKEKRIYYWKSLRVAITGCSVGPDLTSIINLISIRRTIDRVRKVMLFSHNN